MGGLQTSGSEVVALEDGFDELPEVKLLTSGQRSLLVGFLTTGEKNTALEQSAGYGSGAAAATAWRSKRMQDAIKAVANAELRGPMVLRAVRTMNELMQEKAGRSDNVRIKAAAWVLEAASLGAKHDDSGLGRKPLAEMTEDELAQFIESQRGVIEREGHAGIINITPNK